MTNFVLCFLGVKIHVSDQDAEAASQASVGKRMLSNPSTAR